jgi:ribose transport system substrate-binding protein
MSWKHIKVTAAALAATYGTCMMITGFATPVTAKDPITIAGVSILIADPYFISVKCGAQDAAKALDVKLDWAGSTDAEVAAQRQIFDARTLRDPAGYVMTPFNQTAFIAPVKDAMAKGKPVALADATMAENVFYQGFHSDNELAMREIAGYLAANFKDPGKVAVVAFGPANPIDEARYTSLPALLKKTAPSLELLAPQFAKGSSTDAAQVVAGLIQAHPDLVAVYATNGPQAEGAASAIRAAKLTDKIRVIAYSAAPADIQGLRDGKFSALLAQSPYLVGKSSVESVVKYLRSHDHAGPVQPLASPYSLTPTKLITKDNIDAPETQDYVYKTC